jgi:hypothetical protein
MEYHLAVVTQTVERLYALFPKGAEPLFSSDNNDSPSNHSSRRRSKHKARSRNGPAAPSSVTAQMAVARMLMETATIAKRMPGAGYLGAERAPTSGATYALTLDPDVLQAKLDVRRCGAVAVGV